MRKYIIDTDIGDDIDDALALDLALRSNLDVVAVTTVYRNTVDRARMAKRLISLLGRDVPVYFGYGATLDGLDESFPLCQWTKQLECESYAPDNVEPEEAVDLILQNAKRYGKDFFVLALGPLTNVARAIKKDPKTMQNCGGVILMGGDYVNDYAEWNILCDVNAAKEVFSSNVDIIAFGHEVTSKTRVTTEQQNYVFSLGGNEYREYLGEISRLWHLSKDRDYRIILHDLLVIRYVLEPTYCSLCEGEVLVQTALPNRAKMLVNHPQMGGKKIRYAVDVDEREFVEYFMNKLG